VEPQQQPFLIPDQHQQQVQQVQMQQQQMQQIPPEVLSGQLYNAIIEDGVDGDSANKVMEMLARLPAGDIHTCLSDASLRTRMVQRCLQQLSA
jgi:hypothetical protein